MGVPATTGNEKQHISEMRKNDYIKVQATSLDNWLVGDAVTSTTELSTSGVVWATSGIPFQQYFYMIKVDKGLLIADRIWQHTVSWDTLNVNFLIEGRAIIIDDIVGQLRSLTGGIAYADENGNSSSIDLGFGTYPTSNEWDKYIVTNSEKFLFDNNSCNSCIETPILNININKMSTIKTTNIRRTFRGKLGEATVNYINDVWFTPSEATNATVGKLCYRPVFEYNENNL